MPSFQVVVTTPKGAYAIERFNSYSIDLSLDIPADHFNLQFVDARGIYVDLFAPGDRISVYKDGAELLTGIVDDVDDRETGDGGMSVTLDGRDTSLLLLENDAIPATLYNVTLADLAKRFCSPYNAFKLDVEAGTPIAKLPINTGEAEWEILDREARKQGKRVWMSQGDTLHIKAPDYKQDAAYTFERGNSIPGSIPIESAVRRRTGANRKSDVWVRSTKGDAITYKLSDPEMSSRRVTRRRIIDTHDKDSEAEVRRQAEQTLEQSKVGSWEYTATIHGKHLVYPGRIARVVDGHYGLDGNLFIVGVTFKYDLSSGSRTDVRMRKLEEAF